MPGRSLQFHLLSFEGPDDYSRAGGIASRVTGLARALADAGFDCHLWFIGDPSLPGHEDWEGIHLHRWCQWISRYHPAGVYDGEDGKRADLTATLPPFLVRELLAPRISGSSGGVVVMAEEWQTADTVLHLDEVLRRSRLRDRVAIFWNANNTFGFDRVDWRGLSGAVTITTVSRFMRQKMWAQGVDPLVIPNGVPADALLAPDRRVVDGLRRTLKDRLVLCKVARWDPDKRWLLAVETVADLKRRGLAPLLIARGGVEAHGAEVLARVRALGLEMVERRIGPGSTCRVVESLHGLERVDVVSLRSFVRPECLRVLYRGSAAVLANSGSEPFGLVGLEGMAAGGIVAVGGTGEDYAVPGWNAFLLQTLDPREFWSILGRVLFSGAENRDIRRRAMVTARRYAWPEIIRRDLLPRVPLTAPRLVSAGPSPGAA